MHDNNNNKKSLQLLKHAVCGAQLHQLLYIVILPLFYRKLRFQNTNVQWKERQSEQTGDY